MLPFDRGSDTLFGNFQERSGDSHRIHTLQLLPSRRILAGMAQPNSTESASPTGSSETLAQLRSAIDQLDDRIHDLLIERANLVYRVGELKGREAEGRKSDGQFYRPEREAQIHRRLEERHHGPLPVAAIHRIYREIISASLSLEKRMRIVYLGPEATYTHQAAMKHFGSSCDMAAARTTDELFSDVETGRYNFGVVPVESSIEGMVNHTLDRFVDSPLCICAEILLPGVHNLLSRETDIREVQVLYSHYQSLEHCRDWLDRHLPNIRTEEVESTAQAAELACQTEKSAAIAGVYAADKYRLNILVEHIEDRADMEHRFLVVGRQEPLPSGRDQTSLMFSVRDRPGFLYRALGIFAHQEINLTRIESRPSKRRAWDYLFYVDFEGHQTDAVVKAALGDLSNLPGVTAKILGSYPRPAL